MIVEQQAVIKESHIYILYSLDTTFPTHTELSRTDSTHLSRLWRWWQRLLWRLSSSSRSWNSLHLLARLLYKINNREYQELLKVLCNTTPPHAAYWDAHYKYYMLKLLLYWFTDSQQLYNSTYKNFTHTNRKINKLQRHWLINMLKIIVILVDERVVMYRRSGEARFALNDYFLLPLPESLELVLDPLPELELSPSLELSELLLSLRRDTCPSNPTITQHSILNNFKCWILRITYFL